jgi:hypothetical protein
MEKVNGLIMVKPHAVKAGLAPVIKDILNGARVPSNLDRDDPMLRLLPRLTVVDSIYMDLCIEKYGEDLINLFYQDKVDRRYFPLIRELYMGKVAFLALNLSISKFNIVDACNSIKGTTETFNNEGVRVTTAIGLRGALGAAYPHYNNEELADLDDWDYRQRIIPVINNYIHVPDKPGEVEAVLEIINT